MAKAIIARRERKFAPYFGVCKAITALLHPHAEVVLHDSESGTVVGVWNALSDRVAGDLSHMQAAPDLFPAQDILGPYEKALSPEGRAKSVTTRLVDEDGTHIGFLCINLNLRLADELMAQLNQFTAFVSKRPEPIYRSDIREHINYLVHDYLLAANKTLENLNRRERIELVKLVNENGLFQARGTAPLLAKALGISRAGIYNLLAEIRKEAA